jgi:predicted ATPase
VALVGEQPRRPGGRIVLSGAPGSGKSTVCRELARRHAERIVIVPEAATQVYSALGFRWDQIGLEQKRDAQRAIYRLQVEQERRIRESRPDLLLLLDRGTIDGAAYWPDGPDAYWLDLGTTYARELSRYDQVILLESSAAIGKYDGDASNRTRFEKADEALQNAAKLEALWSAHPNRAFVAATDDFEDKILAVQSIVIGA